MIDRDRRDPRERFERPLLDNLWVNFREFRRVTLPPPEVKGRLPIDVIIKNVSGPILSGYLTSLLEHVWIKAFEKTPGWENSCLYLDICLWDPFRNDARENWAKTGKGIQQDISQFKDFEQEVKEQGIDVYYLLYKVLRKEILGIKVSAIEKDKEVTVRALTDIKPLVTPKSDEPDVKLLSDLLKVIAAHHHFAIKGSDLHIYYIPSLFYPKESGTGIGGLILHSKASISHTTLIKFQTILDSMLSKIGVFYLFENYFHQSVRSAISSIMARNMSHNMGSHVMPRASVESVRRRLEGMDLWPEMRGWVSSRHYLESMAQLKTNWEIISRLKGNLDEYTQRKSDFLAEITTEPLMATRPAFFYREVILPLEENTLFMDNIAANEGVRYDARGLQCRLKLRVLINGEELKARYTCDACAREAEGTRAYTNELPYSLTCPRHHGQRLQISQIENGDNDVEIELPGPLGEFALYSFLENYIRNAAKHNKEQLKSGRDMEIYIHIDDLEDAGQVDYYRVRIWNTIVDPHKPVNISCGDGTYESLREAISALITSRIIQPDGSLKREAWGIAEMKICAVLLRGPEDYVTAVEESEALQVAEESIFGQTRLVYEFRLMRSKRLCAVLPGWNNEERRKELKQEGIWIFRSVNDLEKNLGAGDTLASFRFALFDCSRASAALAERPHIINAWPRLLSKFPFRVLVLTGKDDSVLADVPHSAQAVAETLNTAKLEQMEPGELMEWAWHQWLCRWLDDPAEERIAAVNVYLDQEAEDDPTARWVEHADHFNRSSESVQLRIFAQDRLGAAHLLNQTRPTNVNIMYDRHRGLRDALYTELQDSADWSYLLLEKHSPDFTTLFSPKFPTPEDARYWTLPWEMAEAGLLRVLVVDERAAEFSLDNLDDEIGDVLIGLMAATSSDDLPDDIREEHILKWHLAWAAKVYICTHFAIEQEPEPLHDRVARWQGTFPCLKMRVDKTGETIAPYNISILGASKAELRADMILIHQGVIDEWRNRNADFRQDKFLSGLKQHFPFVVVESGRGIPPTLSSHEKFLPFSLLQHNILGNVVGKYGLTRVLMSLARRKRSQT